jgi:hypothetical protein
VRVGVTQIGWDGTIRRRALDTWCLADAHRWEYIIGQVLTVPARLPGDAGQAGLHHPHQRSRRPNGGGGPHRPVTGLGDYDPGDRRPSMTARRRAGP